MYILSKDGIVKYPYSITQLKLDNPNVSFPYSIGDELLKEYGVYRVTSVQYPNVDYTKNVTEELPKLVEGVWYQNYLITDASVEEINQRKVDLNLQAQANRAEAYRNESDPLFFKWQRGKATEQEWLDKIQEIEMRYPGV